MNEGKVQKYLFTMKISGTSCDVISTVIDNFGSLPVMEMISWRNQELYFLPQNVAQGHTLQILHLYVHIASNIYQLLFEACGKKVSLDPSSRYLSS